MVALSPWHALLVLVVILGIPAAIVAIAVSASRRHRPSGPVGGHYPTAYPSAPAVGAPPPGWYPDPQLPGTQRWWDGTRWTDHTSGPGQP